jgi:hypothetical protein
MGWEISVVRISKPFLVAAVILRLYEVMNRILFQVPTAPVFLKGTFIVTIEAVHALPRPRECNLGWGRG